LSNAPGVPNKGRTLARTIWHVTPMDISIASGAVATTEEHQIASATWAVRSMATALKRPLRL
jgi:hypothetical protein